MRSMLKISNIETLYGRIQALRGISLEVPEGSIVAILGANGAGKSSILKTVCGLLDDQPDKGTIEFGARRIDGLDAPVIVRMGISYVPEGREIFPELTVIENLLMGAYYRRYDRSTVKEEMERVLEVFPALAERRNQLGGKLSGGEQQMLTIGRGLMSKPKLLLLDEPSLGLAPVLVREIYRVIEDINGDGVTILLVEQNARAALSVAHHGYVLENGRIVLDDSAGNLMANEDVQEFYLGMKQDAGVRGTKRYRRKKRWR